MDRALYRVIAEEQQVLAYLVGIRKEGSRRDVYVLAERLVRRGLKMSTSQETEEMCMVNARRELTKLPERLAVQPATVAVTRRGKPVLAIMTWEDYEAVLETLDILSDEDASQQLRQSIREVKEGITIPWEKAKAGLGA